ncbi:hypothetical protein [Methylomonas koyamae]|uniref:hypothetical protein n=1 Tax=Methylomonas koyamae TaxID=702114 RepID=UPI002873674C|nr:hypothetical protein [Methylomonas koyamae]WNB76604.1 hypothetical protein RI210_03235 [Methylomonas koyamae]
MQDDMISALQAVCGAGQGSLIPLAPAAVPLPAAVWPMPLGLSLLGAGGFRRRSTPAIGRQR